MTEIRKAPHPDQFISGRLLISYLNPEDSYGADLPGWAQRLLWAAQALCNMNVHESSAETRLAGRSVLFYAKTFLEEAGELLMKETVALGEEDYTGEEVCDD